MVAQLGWLQHSSAPAGVLFLSQPEPVSVREPPAPAEPPSPEPARVAPKAPGIARAASRFGAATMLSRLLGLVREQMFAALIGAGFYADAFVVAFRIPNLL